MFSEVLDQVISGLWWISIIIFGFLVYPTAVSAGWVKDEWVMRNVVLRLRTPARRWLAQRASKRDSRVGEQ